MNKSILFVLALISALSLLASRHARADEFVRPHDRGRHEGEVRREEVRREEEERRRHEEEVERARHFHHDVVYAPAPVVVAPPPPPPGLSIVFPIEIH